ncbi:MAG: hypothetical protein GF372_13430 [Candidatus Marinimicrobia bacterium]|nr:hypothetical protein [Candidatus Neomarinimicrobiota bacterium]
MNDINNDPVLNWVFGLKNLIDSYKKWSGTVSNHSSMKGDSREFFIREILSRFLPDSTKTGTGQIIDLKKNLSRQVDIVIAKNDYPVLTSLSQSDTYFSNSVIATIEIKSQINRESLFGALANSKSVKMLQYDASPNNFYQRRSDIPATCIYGLTGYKSNIKAIKTTVANWINFEQPSYWELPNIIITEGIVVLINTGEIINQNYFRNILRLDNQPLFLISNKVSSFNWFIFYLLYRTLKFEYSQRITFDHFSEQFHPDDWEYWGSYELDSEKGIIDLDYSIE